MLLLDAMSDARPILPDSTYLITRRCTQRHFLLRPDAETNQIFLYCLAVSAERHGVSVLFSSAMSNHHHTIVHDPRGQVVRFYEDLHKLLARCMNRLRKRRENFWSTERTSLEPLTTPAAVLSAIAYAALNPVKDGLVEALQHWPGVSTAQLFLRGGELRVQRPRGFFRARGPMPEIATLRLGWPEHLGSLAAAREFVRTRIASFEAEAKRERLTQGRRVLGRRAVLRQSPTGRPSSEAALDSQRLAASARRRAARIAELEASRLFRASYRDARERWLRDGIATFPPGTYRMRGLPGVIILD